MHERHDNRQESGREIVDVSMRAIVVDVFLSFEEANGLL